MTIDEIDTVLVDEIRAAVRCDMEISAVVAHAAEGVLEIANANGITGRVAIAYALAKLLHALEDNDDNNSAYAAALCSLCYRTQQRLARMDSVTETYFHAGGGKAAKA
jgi:hypothetical protein